MILSRVALALSLLAIPAGIPSRVAGQTPEQVRLAFRNIRSDDIPSNANIASGWLFAHRDQLTRELVDELYRTDRQGRDVILSTLMLTDSFHPDDRFCRTLVSRLNEEDKYVPNASLNHKTHWQAWRYFNTHYDQFKDLLLENLQTTEDMWCIWGTVCLLEKRGELADTVPRFSPHVWDTIGRSLQADNISYNAGQAIRVYLIIGKDSLPHLAPLAKSSEPQTRDYASATIDAMNGSRRAYGYLGSQVRLDLDLFPGRPHAADWLSAELDKWDPHSRVRQRYEP